jgi:hypothetical protein
MSTTGLLGDARVFRQVVEEIVTKKGSEFVKGMAIAAADRCLESLDRLLSMDMSPTYIVGAFEDVAFYCREAYQYAKAVADKEEARRLGELYSRIMFKAEARIYQLIRIF